MKSTNNIDDLMRQIELDDLEDEATEVKKLTPIDYAKLRGMRPQQVYYNLKKHKDLLQSERCSCGRRVIDVEQADLYFGFKRAEDDTEEQDDPGSELRGTTSEGA